MASVTTPVPTIPIATAPAPKAPTSTGLTSPLVQSPQAPAPAPGAPIPNAVPPAGAPSSQVPPPGVNAPGVGPPGAGGLPGGPAAGGHGSQNPKKINGYIYIPSFTMSIVGSIAYLLTAGFHIHQVIKYKAWYFTIVTQGVLMAAAAMIARTHSVMTLKETGITGPFMVFMILDSIGPTLLVIGTFFTMTRIIWWVTPNERRNIQTLKAPPMIMSLMWGGFFTLADVGKAVGQHGFKPNDPLGMKIQEIGQVIQFFVLAGFMLWSLRFMRMSRRWLIHNAAEEKRWRKLGWTVVAVSALLTFRWMFSVVAMDARADPKSFFSQHEWLMWVSEELPVFISFALYNINFPGEFLPREYIRFRIKLKEIEKAKLENQWPLTISSPIRSPSDDKHVEITLTELENGRMVGRSQPRR